MPFRTDQTASSTSASTKVTDVVTNLANGNSVTSVATVRDKDQRVTDNGDGTLTILVLTTGNAVIYGEDGKAIEEPRPGSIRDPDRSRRHADRSLR